MRSLLLLLCLAVACLEPKPLPIDSEESTDQDGDGAALPADCDDADPAVHPGADELCDGLDQDCDRSIDEGAEQIFFPDADADGHGDPSAPQSACEAPAGFVSTGDDCDDQDDTIYDGAEERCESLDNDCDGAVDEHVREIWYFDRDQDGYGDPLSIVESCLPPDEAIAVAGDCDDDDANAFPDNPEACDESDNDCDGSVDEGVSTRFWQDLDGDGYGDPTFSIQACTLPTGYADNAEDCDDGDGGVSPADDELCGGDDEDCDGQVDEAGAVDAPVWFFDQDRDGYGDPAISLVQCAQPTGYVSNDADCLDGEATVNPSVAESCNGVDDDCDSQVDESGAVDVLTFYDDADQDGYGDPNAPRYACEPPSGTVTNAEDCADIDPLAFPGSHATETPLDGIDQDCDGYDGCTDLTCDGYPDLLLVGHYDGDYVSSAWIYPYNGSFSESTRVSLPSYGAWEARVEDFNGDGYQDILLPTYYTGSTHTADSYLYWGSATGYSTANRTGLPTIGAGGTLVEDLNGDGYRDIVFASYYSGSSYTSTSYVYWGSASGFSSGNRTALSTTGVRSVDAADFDQDGYLDLVFSSYYNGSTYASSSPVFWGSATGFTQSDRTDLSTTGAFPPAIGDANGDGYLDLVFPSHYSGTSYVSTAKLYYGSATGFSSAYSLSLTDHGAQAAAIVDLNGDGYNEVVLGGYFATAWNLPASTYLYTGSSLGISSAVYTTLDNRGTLGMEVRDLDNDGYPELIAARHYDGTGYNGNSYVYWGSASGWSTSSRDSLPGYGPTHVTVGDINGDGYPEVVLPNYYSGAWPSTGSSYVYWGGSNGYSSSNRTALSATGVYGAPVIVGDAAW